MAEHFLFPIPKLDREYTEKNGVCTQHGENVLYGRVKMQFTMSEGKINGLVSYTNQSGLMIGLADLV